MQRGSPKLQKVNNLHFLLTHLYEMIYLSMDELYRFFNISHDIFGAKRVCFLKDSVNGDAIIIFREVMTEFIIHL